MSEFGFAILRKNVVLTRAEAGAVETYRELEELSQKGSEGNLFPERSAAVR